MTQILAMQELTTEGHAADEMPWSTLSICFCNNTN